MLLISATTVSWELSRKEISSGKVAHIHTLERPSLSASLTVSKSCFTTEPGGTKPFTFASQWASKFIHSYGVPQRLGCLLCLFESAFRTELSLVHFIYFVYLFLSKVEIYALSTSIQLMFWLTGACYYDSNQSMYVFGGCTQSSCNAAFNDLWRLDLNSKEWIRPLASGTSPLLPVKLAEIAISSYKILIMSLLLQSWDYKDLLRSINF